MLTEKPATETIVPEIKQTIARLDRDIHAVEVWAAALLAFARPVPDFDATAAHESPPTAPLT